VNYGYDRRYLLTASIRADGTSRFGADNRWGYFPSAAVGWVITSENFMEDQKIFDNLKLRASWGQVGNDAIPTSLFYSIATPNRPYYYGSNLNLGITFDEITDKNIGWEVTEEFDFGVDFTLLQKRLEGTIDYYNKKTKDALVYVTFAGTLGDQSGTVLTNLGDFRNTGVEVSLDWSDDIGKDWSYTIGGNIAFNKNEIVGLNGGNALPDGNIGGQGFVTRSDNGQPIGSFYIRKAIGIIQNEQELANAGYAGAKIGDLMYEDRDKNHVIDDNDRMFLGSYIPKITYGFNGSLDYKNFDFSFNMYGTQGSKIYNGKKATRGTDARDNLEADEARNRWTPNNPGNSIPRAHTNQIPASSYFLESGDFLRLNNITLGYTLPSKSLSKYKVTSLRVYLSAQNLFTITPYSGFTPEITSSSLTNAGIELNAYPSTRTYAFGVNLAF
jgi:TonB-linked SusC/RagA family outer membrane protein